MGKKLNVEGQRFGRLVVLDCTPEGADKGRWFCLCDCGTTTLARSSNIVRGFTKGCGCRVQLGNTTHGMFGTREYTSWHMLRQRCTNLKNKRWKLYGGRGILVCERWSTFENFYADMGPRPPGTSIDRIDVNGNYEPSNCRWADAKTQALNKQAVHVTP